MMNLPWPSGQRGNVCLEQTKFLLTDWPSQCSIVRDSTMQNMNLSPLAKVSVSSFWSINRVGQEFCGLREECYSCLIHQSQLETLVFVVSVIPC